MFQPDLEERSGIFRLMGFDFMMDQNLDLWFIEANPAPQLDQILTERSNFMRKMLRDASEILYALLRSRMLRVRRFIIEFLDEHVIPNNYFDLEKIQKRFKKVNRDGFEPEFIISPENEFSKVMDLSLGENNEGYMGLLDDSCF